MNIKGNPYEARETKSGKKGHRNTYRREAIWDYEEKVDKEKARWRKLAADNREKMTAGIRKRFENDPAYGKEKAADMLAKGGNEARKKIAEKKTELKTLAEECGCVTPITMTWEKQDKSIAYFKKLKEVRDRMKAEREKSL